MQCSVDGCERRSVARGWCDTHWRRWRRTGSVELVRRPSPLERFTAKLTEGPPPPLRPDLGPCLLWTASKLPSGYATIRVNGRQVYIHRFAWELTEPPLQPGEEVDHMCLVKHCARRSHLRLTDHSENAQNHAGKPNRGAHSKYRGVTLHKPSGLWQVRIEAKGVRYSGGYFRDEDEAGEAARQLRLKHHTHNDLDRR